MKDLIVVCNEPGKSWFMSEDRDFAELFCSACKNPRCQRAKRQNGEETETPEAQS